MQTIGKFKILDSFKITRRGLVARGEILEGIVKVGAGVTIDTGMANIFLTITGVEMMDNISTREHWVCLTFFYTNKIGYKDFEDLKLPVQIVDIVEQE